MWPTGFPRDDAALRGDRRGAAALLAGALVALAPALARANDMSGLAWVVLIWPPGVAGVVVMLALTLVLVAATPPAPRLGRACMIVSVIFAVSYPVYVVLLTDESDTSLVVMTLVPFLAVAALCFAMGRRARRRAASLRG